MENHPENERLRCPDCGAVVSPMAVRCWRCQRTFPRGPKAAGAIAAPDATPEAPLPPTFVSLIGKLLLGFVIAVVILLIVAASIFFAFFMICTSQNSNSNFDPITVLVIVGTGVTISAIFLFVLIRAAIRRL
jgi:uncharacterized membrane protein YccC